jgi:class 3 adenylate cyclase
MAFSIMIFLSAILTLVGFLGSQKARKVRHLREQISKILYKHQLHMIYDRELAIEETMPVYTDQACVLSFDIIGSSKIQHVNSKRFFRNVFAQCNEVMSVGYDGVNLKANAYRIKEMGDGFLCSVGYPFSAMSDNPANDAIGLAKEFAKILRAEAKSLHSDFPIACGIGIALDTITGFYPVTGTKEYDLYGPALILATRYEGMRKILFPETNRSVLILQEKVYRSLDPSHREGFIEISLKQQGIAVRDDSAATHIYYQYLDGPHGKSELTPNHLQVV